MWKAQDCLYSLWPQKIYLNSQKTTLFVGKDCKHNLPGTESCTLCNFYGLYSFSIFSWLKPAIHHIIFFKLSLIMLISINLA